MAEAVAIVGLVSSIASLVDLSARVVSRLNDFTSKTSEVPESFRSLSIRLPLLAVTLERIQTQAKASRLPDDVTKAWTVVVNDTSEQVLAVQTCMSKILPPDSASKLDRALKALKSLAKKDEIQQALEKIEKNNDILVIHQTTLHVDTGDLILAQLSDLTMISKFSQLPLAAQEKFIAQQEKQLSQFVEQEEAKVLEFLTVFDTRDRLTDRGRQRTEGSCDWILQSQDYLEWFEGKCNRLRLCPGTGKTVMSAFITEALNDRLKDEDILAIYACSFTDPQTKSATSILYALAAQIAQSSLASMEKCKRFLEKHVSEGQLKAKILNIQDLIVEMSLSDDIQRIFIVIDGLDEVEWEQPDHLMAVVDIPRYARKIKMFITSRPDPLIAKALYEYSTLTLDNITLDLTLAGFIDMAIKRSKLANLPQHELDEIKESLIRKSDGVYVSSLMINDHVHRVNAHC
ncbi:hypothetical protein MMC22_005206 [Lobaria immixta]|nr:hypothetical protein [Lobaria immixta]